jgi:hypothetical protein
MGKVLSLSTAEHVIVALEALFVCCGLYAYVWVHLLAHIIDL